ncbi:hypothetical protein B0H14DRAFT_2626166 [Mycena olivaceomarginata]|nr:hypothetical protein B0H14DRAFT_2626166 [Mycena olivaceomarginata]
MQFPFPSRAKRKPAAPAKQHSAHRDGHGYGFGYKSVNPDPNPENANPNPAGPRVLKKSLQAPLMAGGKGYPPENAETSADRGSALWAASANGHEQIVCLLLREVELLTGITNVDTVSVEFQNIVRPLLTGTKAMRQKREPAEKLAATATANADAEMADGTKTVGEPVALVHLVVCDSVALFGPEATGRHHTACF